MTIVMLAPKMTMGHGVAEAVAMQMRSLREIGIEAAVGCVQYDDHYTDVAPARVAPDADAVADFAIDHGASVIIAHGSPYFEVLPQLSDRFRTIVYEYGDPTPELFADDALQRRRGVEWKHRHLYPKVATVAAISEFVRHDIGWPAHVIRLGVEHVPDLGTKPDPRNPDRSLRVGVLMRLGVGEARYKGHSELLDLIQRVPDVQWEVAGRGAPDHARALIDAGVTLHLNPDDEARTRFLRDLDVFVTASLWEGTNLPLVEAQALGTPGLAFETGAHPEFTPFVFDSVSAMALQLEVYRTDSALLADHGDMSYRFVRERLSWSRNATELAQLCAGAGPPPPSRSRVSRELARGRRFLVGLSRGGVRETIRYHRRPCR